MLRSRKYSKLTVIGIAVTLIFIPLSKAEYSISTRLPPQHITNPNLKFDFSSIEEILNQNNPKSVDQLLNYFPEDILASYALVYRSRSLQKAFPDKPRVLMFEPNRGQIIMSFNAGEPDKNTLEVINFDHQTKRFSFHEIEFSQNKFIIRNNPQKCTSCHDGKPIFDAYPVWPGFYGSHDDRLFLFPEEASVEKSSYQQIDRTKPPYRRLKALNPERPNTTLGLFLNQLNYQKVARDIKTDAQLLSFRYTIIAAILGCKIEDFPKIQLLSPNVDYLNAVQTAFLKSEKSKMYRENIFNKDWNLPQQTSSDQDFLKKLTQFLPIFNPACDQFSCRRQPDQNLQFLDLINIPITGQFDLSLKNSLPDINRDGLLGLIEALPYLANELLTVEESKIIFSTQVLPLNINQQAYTNDRVQQCQNLRDFEVNSLGSFRN